MDAQVTTATLEFPVSLDAVLSVSLDVDNLKLILNYLLGLLRGHDGLLHGLRSQFEK